MRSRRQAAFAAWDALHAGEDRRARCSAGVRRRRHPGAKHAPPGAALRRRVDAPDRAAAARQDGSGLRGQGGCQPTNDRPNSLKKRAPQAGRCPACRRASSRDQQRQGRQGCLTCRRRLHQGFSSSGNAGTPLPGISAMRRIKAARKPAPSISTGKSARTVSKAGKTDTASGNRGYTYGWHPSSGVVFLYQKLFQNRSRCGG